MRRCVVLLTLVFPVLALAARTSGGSQTARPWIGILLDTQKPGLRGVAVKDVLPNTPAEKAGLKKLDEILSIDGAAVKTAGDLIGRVQEKGVGQQVSLKVLRAKKELTVSLALEAKPDELKMLRDALQDKPAPSFEVPGASLAAVKGNVVVLEFWATWCGPCRSSLPRLDAWQKKYAARGLKVVGVSDETPEVVAAFAAKQKLSYPLGSDPKAKEAYFAPVIPMLVVIDRAGVVKHVEIGAGQKLDNVEQAFLPLLGAK
jgi:thiol-disulfide isomerase/thioredoxin